MPNKKKGTPRKGARKKRNLKDRTRGSSPPRTIIDPRARERVMFDIGRLVKQQDFQSVEEANGFIQQFVGAGRAIPESLETMTPVERAQGKMYQAWGATGQRRVNLAREAMEISPLCADAYVLLAEETARTPEEAWKLYEVGMQMGERALGPEAFRESVGKFWGVLETRPYMRARQGVARALSEMDRREEAMAHYKELLRLNPDDNQGNRYELLCCFLGEGMDDEASKLLKEYDEESTEWFYSRALLAYRKGGASAKAAKLLRKALAQNKWVPAYITGIKKAPKRLPAYVGVGDESEAVYYLQRYAEAWVGTPGVLVWFVEELGKVLREFEESNEA